MNSRGIEQFFRGRRFRAFAIGLSLVAVAAVVAGCGGSSSSSSGGSSSSGESSGESTVNLSQYEKIVEAAKAPPKWEGPTKAVKAPTGQSAVIVDCALSIEGCKIAAEASEAAFSALNWKSKVIPTGGAGTLGDAVQSAIDLNPNVIFLVGIECKLVSSQLAEARQKHIVTVSQQEGCTPGPESVEADVTPDGKEAGKILGAAMIVNEEGNVVAQFLNAPEFGLPTAVVEGAKAEVETCSTCEVKPDLNFSSTQIETQLPQQVVASLRANSDINSMLVGFDPPTTVIVPAIDSAGLSSQVKMYSQLGTTAALELLSNEDVLVADASAGDAWSAWGAVDQSIRLLLGEEPVEQGLQYHLLTAENVPPAGQAYTGEGVEYEKEYEKLWGVGAGQ